MQTQTFNCTLQGGSSKKKAVFIKPSLPATQFHTVYTGVPRTNETGISVDSRSLDKRVCVCVSLHLFVHPISDVKWRGDWCSVWRLLFCIVSPAPESCPYLSHIPQLYPPCSSSALVSLSYLLDAFHPFTLSHNWYPTILYHVCVFLCRAVQLGYVCRVDCVFSPLIYFSCWHQPVHLPVCVFADILFINVSAEGSTSGAAVSLQRHCRRSKVESLFYWWPLWTETLRDLCLLTAGKVNLDVPTGCWGTLNPLTHVIIPDVSWSSKLKKPRKESPYLSGFPLPCN